MKLELVIVAITGFLVFNTYHDNKYSHWFKINKKMMKMATIGFVGMSLYLMVKRSPGEATQLMKHATNLVKYMPIDRTSASMIGPAIEMMSNRRENMELMRGAGMDMTGAAARFGMLEPQTKRMLRSGGSANSRSVSESKKKFVASRQNWKCADCQQPLPVPTKSITSLTFNMVGQTTWII